MSLVNLQKETPLGKNPLRYFLPILVLVLSTFGGRSVQGMGWSYVFNQAALTASVVLPTNFPSDPPSCPLSTPQNSISHNHRIFLLQGSFAAGQRRVGVSLTLGHRDRHWGTLPLRIHKVCSFC